MNRYPVRVLAWYPEAPGHGLDGPTWRDVALCAETDPEIFYPEKGEKAAAAKRICAACEVRVQCLDYALANHERYGIWGGTTERARGRMIADRERATAGLQRCKSRRHVLTGETRRPDGGCRLCSEIVSRTNRARALKRGLAA